MSEAAASPSPAGPRTGYYKLVAGVAAVMTVLALVGVGLTTTNRPAAQRYWMWLVPAYGVLCIVVAWVRSRQEAGGLAAVGRQVLHWLTITGAVALDFWVSGTGEQAGLSTGFDALLLLAVGCVLAGIHVDWVFTVVGGLLAVTLVCVVKADQYLWLVVVAGAVLVVGIAAAIRVIRGTSAAEPVA